ncbi:MAG: HEAT repeat domain-containing protein [Elusimicrobia bacterium]|nr:HEAT repeat domain-containing protein [Elusimicrobiota bacterium]
MFLVPAGLWAQKADRLADNDPSVRSKAAEEAGREGAAGVAAMLKRLPSEKNPAVALQLVHSLGRAGDSSAVKSLADQAAGGADSGIRAEACMSLSSFPGDKAAEEALRKALLRSGEEDNVRVSAAYSLIMAFRGSKTAVAALETALKSGGKALKAGITDNLRHISKTPEGKYLLGVAYADSDPELKGSAGKIIYGVDVKEGRDSRRK